MRFWRVSVTLIVATAVLVGGLAVALAQPTSPVLYDIPFANDGAEYARLGAQMDAAAVRAVQLDREASAVQAELVALESRLAVTEQRITTQREILAIAEAALSEAQVRYDEHMVVVYKRGSVEPLSLLLTSDSLADLVGRVSVLARMAAQDADVVADLNVAAADARYQASALEDLRDQDTALRAQQKARLAMLRDALEEQERLVARLGREARDALRKARKLDAETRRRWRASSLPIGSPIPRAEAVIFPSDGTTYLVSAYMPRAYRTTEQRFTAMCSWYGPGFNGRGSASGQIFNEDDYTCASRTLPFGTILALTRGDKHIIVYVNDRGPFITGRDLDLSKAAARALGISGVNSVAAEIIVPFDGIE